MAPGSTLVSSPAGSPDTRRSRTGARSSPGRAVRWRPAGPGPRPHVGPMLPARATARLADFGKRQKSCPASGPRRTRLVTAQNQYVPADRATSSETPALPGDESSHLTIPVRFGRRKTDQVGHLIFAGRSLLFHGTVDMRISW